jgi:hypothetical protein
VHSLFWRQPTVHLVDQHAVPGTKATYRVRAVDTFGSGGSPLSPASLPTAVLCAPGSHIHAAVTRVSVHRLRHHRKVVRVQVCTAARVTVSARLTRRHHVLAHAVKQMQPGHRRLGLRVSRHRHGRAHLRVVFRQGAVRQVTRLVVRLR